MTELIVTSHLCTQMMCNYLYSIELSNMSGKQLQIKLKQHQFELI